MKCMPDWYPLVRSLLMSLPAEFSHDLTMHLLRLAPRRIIHRHPYERWGLTFQNPVGLAAGLDKNGDFIEPLWRLGFGHIEIGAVTPVSQPGNPKPRLFRLKKERAILNRMGFNNRGADYVACRLATKPRESIVGVNIGKNHWTPLEQAHLDYQQCLTKLYPYADYFSVNISSPNTSGLRDLQGQDFLYELLQVVQATSKRLANKHDRHVPILIKVSPDLTHKEIESMATCFNEMVVDGVIATNTTVTRAMLDTKWRDEQGGLSGQPLSTLSTDVVRSFRRLLQSQIPIIGVGGIDTPKQACLKKQAGADLVQIYTGLVYRGPRLIEEIVQQWEKAP